uniref:Uncharacterized protein n=1 Tax=Tanacetum cinerariifolium TaxID=118510 RepID=A0A6L2KHA3_TANCI|nr:hypothetical protein [Tanacetum cinerariifolium]
MKNANPSCSTSNREFLDPKKKKEIESWLEDSRIVDSLYESDEIEYFDTFPTLEELEYHEWLLKYPKPYWNDFESVKNGPLIWFSIEENGLTRPKKYFELSATEAIQADCDVKATNIILQGLPLEVYILVSNHKVAKELWKRIQLLLQGTSLTKQERKCKLYDEFNKFAYKKGETLRDFYLRFSLLLNDMNIYNIKLEQFQVNTKLLNIVPPKWSKFVIDVKLVQDLHKTNIGQLHAYLGQHEFHANEVCLMHECNSDPLALVATHQMTHNQLSTPLSITHTSNDYQSSVHHNAYSPPSSIPQIAYAPTVKQQQKQPEFPLLDSGLTVSVFKQDPGILEGQVTQTIITHNAAYQADDLDTYDSDCDELNTAKSFSHGDLYHYGSDALAEKAQQLKPKLYDGNVIEKTSAIVISDSEETLMLAEESCSKMLLKQKDPMMLEKKVNTTPVDYDVIRVKSFTSASGLQPSGNTKKDKIQRPPRSTRKNKVKAHPRFRIDSESLNKVSVLVVLDLSKVANPLYSLRDKDLLKSNDLQMEVIVNGDSPKPTRIVDGVVQVNAPTTAEQRLAKKNELKARGTLVMALPDKHQLKFNIHNDAKSLVEAIEKSQLEILSESIFQEYINFKFLRSLPSEWKTHTLIWRNKADLEEQSLDDLFNNLKIYEAEVNDSSTSSHNTQNIAFVSSNYTDSTNELVNAVPSVSVASFQALVSTLLNVDSVSDAMAMLTMRAIRFLQKTGRNLGANGTTAIGFDMSKVECYNFHRRGYFVRDCRSLRDSRNKDTPRRTIPLEVSTSNALVSQHDVVGSYDWSFQADEEPTNYALMEYASSGSSSSSGSDNKTSSKNLSKLLESQIYDKTSLGYDSQVFKSQVFDCDELNSSESDDSVPTSLENDRYRSGEGYHVVPPPYTRTFMLSKPDLVFNETPNASEPIDNVVHVESHTYKPSKDMSKTLRPDAPIVKDWTSDSEDETEIESVPKQKELSFVQTSEHVKTPRTSVKIVEHPKHTKNLKTENQKSRGHKNSWNRKACCVYKSLNHLIKDCDYYEKQMVQNHVWNNAVRVNHHNSARISHPHSNRNVVATTVLTRLRLVPFNAARPVPTAVPQSTVKSPRLVKHVVNKAHSPIRKLINHRTTTKNSNFNQKVTIVKGNPQQALKDKGVVDSGCSRHMTGNISYLSDFEEFNRGYVAFGGNPKGGKISGKELAVDCPTHQIRSLVSIRDPSHD